MGWTLWLIRIHHFLYWLNHQLVEKPSLFYLLHILHIISLDEVFENSPTSNKVRFPLAVSSILLKLVGYHPDIVLYFITIPRYSINYPGISILNCILHWSCIYWILNVYKYIYIISYTLWLFHSLLCKPWHLDDFWWYSYIKY
jgi:hypothetical protein